MSPLKAFLRSVAVQSSAFADEITDGPPSPSDPTDPPPPPPQANGYDLTTRGILAEGFNNVVDPVGLPDTGQLIGIIGQGHVYEPPYYLTRGLHCILYSGCMVLPSAKGYKKGIYEIRVSVKSTGYFALGGHLLWEKLRGAGSDYVVTETKIELDVDVPIGIDGLLSNQNTAGEGYEIQWRGEGIDVAEADEDGYSNVPTSILYPPKNWKDRIIAPVPPPPPPPEKPNPPQYIPPQPDWSTYQTPELPENGVIFPVESPWHQKVTDWEVDPDSAKIMATMPVRAHVGFGQGINGIPINVCQDDDQVIPEWKANWYLTRNGEGDPGPYRIPKNVALESAGIRFPNGWGPLNEGTIPEQDVHMISLDYQARILYEAYQTEMNQNADGSRTGDWRCLSAMKFPFDSVDLKPEGHTSTDASGLAVFPGLVLYQQLRDGYIPHAIRVSVPKTRNGYVHPATHYTITGGGPNTYYPPMGTRLRLRKGVIDKARLHSWTQAILTCLEDFGCIVVDNGGPFLALIGAPDSRFKDKVLEEVRVTLPDISKVFDVLKLGLITYAA